ncbi:MAG TPA: hypothetical protein VIL88_04425 [Devosia sp.]|jgi:hypothetical protein|uniref:hypothetical protein n=1 Tax=Devosia sp. TaxID=1871048 RepID=UPI002F93DB59
MMVRAIQLSEAGAALDAVATEADLMQWHDDWMSSSEYVGMSDDEAGFLEASFEARARLFAGVTQKPPSL